MELGHSRKGCVPNSRLPDGWKVRMDFSTMRPLFTNTESGKTTHLDPRPLNSNEWSVKVDSSKHPPRPYFLNHKTKQTTWNDPRPWPPLQTISSNGKGLPEQLQRDLKLNPLPGNWSAMWDPSVQRVYYIDHSSKKTTWTDPRPKVRAKLLSQDSIRVKGVDVDDDDGDDDDDEFNAAFDFQDEEKASPMQKMRAELQAMGFLASDIARALREKGNDDLSKCCEWIVNHPTPPPNANGGRGWGAADDRLPAMGSNKMKRQNTEETNDMLKELLRQDKQKGVVLSLRQHNFLYFDGNPKENEEFECIICFSDVKLEEIFVLKSCCHYCCLECTKRHVETQMKSLNAAAIRCPHDGCKQLIEYEEVRMVLPPEAFEQYGQFLLDDSLKQDPNCRWCPRPGCGTAMIAESANPMMRCPSQTCNFTFCKNCKEKWHTDLTCEKYQQWKKENAGADDKFAVWASKNTKACPSCSAPIQKNEGCNHMKCLQCKHEFCWLCLSSVLGQDGKYKAGHWALDEKSPCYEKMHT